MKNLQSLTIFFAVVLILAPSSSRGAATHLVDEAPVSISTPAAGVILIDFGKVAFGNLRLVPPPGADGSINVHFGEAFSDGRIDRKPPGTVRYSKARLKIKGAKTVTAAPPADKRNTEVVSRKHPPAILTPSDWGVVLPFRWVEIEGWPGQLLPENIVRQSAFSSAWDDDAASFKSSDEMLNQIWELSRYSIKATTFAGVYVDGDRERIPYEADSYLNQLSHYYTDTDYEMARDTFDHLMQYGTWPTEWAPHMVFMAHADWMQTGDVQWLEPRYESLKGKLLLERAGPDGLILSNAQQVKKTDIVDWPKEERDNYVFTPVNTVVNAFHLEALTRMSELARALNRKSDVADFERRRKTTYAAFQDALFIPDTGTFRDGVGTEHSSLHANLFPLAFGLVPELHRKKLAVQLAERGMRCSVYAAQYLLEGLFENGADVQALELITAAGDRSWRHMVESGTTITWEAWDQKYKPNQDWNHAWGAAPANLLPRYVLGAQPLTPGWSTALIRPGTGKLEFANGKVPTPLGPIFIDWRKGTNFKLTLKLPEGMKASIDLPAPPGSGAVWMNGQPVKAKLARNRWVLEDEVSGSVALEVR